MNRRVGERLVGENGSGRLISRTFQKVERLGHGWRGKAGGLQRYLFARLLSQSLETRSMQRQIEQAGESSARTCHRYWRC